MHRILTIAGAAAVLLLAAAAIAMLTAFAMVMPVAVLHAMGSDTQASRQYAFLSAPAGPLIAVLGYSGLLFTGLHHLNCHRKGCWRIGRHHVGGQVWCNRHQGQARAERTQADVLEEILQELKRIAA